MRLRRRLLFPVAALLGVAVVALPTIASSETVPSITAYNEPGGYGHSWQPATATVGPGGVVKFSNSSGVVPHGLKFTGGPATPSCAGLPAAASEASGATSWQGECTFSAPGTYTFICTVHAEMKGTITVTANGTTTTTPTPTPTTTTTTAPTTTAPGEASSETTSGSPLLGSPSLRSSQRGGFVKGSLDISKAGSGGRLEIDVFARSASLAKTRHSVLARVGRLVRSSLSAGKLSFSVKLNATARKALKRHHRLVLKVEITLTPVHGKAMSITRSVTVHA